MKKFIQLVLVITILLSSMSISYAWDLWVYNKTEYKIWVAVWENNILNDSANWSGDVGPQSNLKLSTRVFLACFNKAKIRIKRVRMEDYVLDAPNDKQCVNRRLEIEQGNDGNTFTVKWATQW